MIVILALGRGFTEHRTIVYSVARIVRKEINPTFEFYVALSAFKPSCPNEDNKNVTRKDKHCSGQITVLGN